MSRLTAPDIRFHYSLHEPLRGHDAVRRFGVAFREAFPDLNFWGTADLLAEGDYVVAQWEGGGTHTGAAFGELPIGSLPAGSGRTMRFTGITGLDDGVAVVQQLGIIPTA